MDDAVQPAEPASRGRADRRWVVGVDGSEHSRHATLWAAEHSGGRADEIQLTTAWNVPVSTPMSPMGPLMTGASVDALEDAARAFVESLAAQIGPSVDAAVTRCVGQGSPAGLLLDTARHASFLVVGSRGQGGFARLVLGSTSTQCATHADVPVAVVPATSPIGDIASIVVAFDASPNSIAALQWANAFAAPGATVECVSVWDATPISAGADQFFFPEACELAEERFEELVARALAPIRRDDIAVHTSFVNGRPRPVLEEFAALGHLLVMGARGHGAVGSTLLGSVSTWLLHHHGGPMVVVPEPPETIGDLDTDHADESD